jgi:exodeoxyribonuclease VII large subunit
MMRGGGSLESFLAFNNEVLVRRVASFPVPVITGIGHDKDIPLVSFASDRNVSTPTAVTALLNSTWLSALGEIKISEQKIFAVYESWLKELGVKIDRSFLRIESKFNEVLEFFKEAEGSILHFLDIIESNISRFSEKISFLEKSLKVNDPRRQLSLGYSIIKSKSSNKIVRSKKDVKKGEKVDILVSDGTIETQVI